MNCASTHCYFLRWTWCRRPTRFSVTSSAVMKKRPLPARQAPDDEAAFGCAGAFRCDGRPGTQDDLSGTLCNGKARTLKVPVIGVAFPKWGMSRLHNRVTDSIERSGGIDNKQALIRLLSLLKYVSGDYKAPD